MKSKLPQFCFINEDTGISYVCDTNFCKKGMSRPLKPMSALNADLWEAYAPSVF